MNNLSREILKSVLTLPTMSFHETAVSTFVKWYALGLNLEVKEDRAGNLLVKYSGGGKNNITFAAHMDHPGLEIISSKGNKGVAALWGKVDPKTFAGSKVIVYSSTGPLKTKIGKKSLSKKYLGRLCFECIAENKISKGDFGHYDLPAIQFQGDLIKTRAADNLVSVAAILELMTHLVNTKEKVNVSGLFTRAEESGFLGAFAAMELNFIPKKVPLIVLECSSAKGGCVEIGNGPAIRVGDLHSTFDPNVDIWLSNVANDLKSKEKHFAYQRALLQGGRCEACVYFAEGYTTGGIAMPLGNYHNHGERGYAPEYVSIKDYQNLIAFMHAIAKSPMPKNPIRAKTAPIWKHYNELKKKLFTTF